MIYIKVRREWKKLAAANQSVSSIGDLGAAGGAWRGVATPSSCWARRREGERPWGSCFSLGPRARWTLKYILLKEQSKIAPLQESHSL